MILPCNALCKAMASAERTVLGQRLGCCGLTSKLCLVYTDMGHGRQHRVRHGMQCHEKRRRALDCGMPSLSTCTIW